MLTSGTDAALEHEVELNGFRDFVVRVRIGDLVVAHELPKLWTRVVVQLDYGADTPSAHAVCDSNYGLLT